MSQSYNDGLKNVQKSVMHVQSCCFTNTNLLLFCRSRCRRRHCCLSSLLLSSKNWATMVTWRHTSPSHCKLFQFRFTDFYSQIVQLNELKGEPALFALNTIYLPLSLSWPSTIQLFRSFSFFFIFPPPPPHFYCFSPRTTKIRRMGTRFRCNNCWFRLGGQALLMIGWWLPWIPSTNHN